MTYPNNIVEALDDFHRDKYNGGIIMIPIHTRPIDKTVTLTLSIVPSKDGKAQTIYLTEVKK
jgi:hypothetical protein